MLSIITVIGDHFFEQATNTKSKPLCKTMGVCNFTKLLCKSVSKQATEWLSEDWILIL